MTTEAQSLTYTDSDGARRAITGCNLTSGQFSDLPTYPSFYDGVSVHEYVRVYERLNAPRFYGRYSAEHSTIYPELSDNPQYTFDDAVTVEHCEGVVE